MGSTGKVEKWGTLEVVLQGPTDGNPFVDVRVSARFVHEGRSAEADGFCDGDGVYLIRFMPNATGQWQYSTRSNRPEIDGKTGRFDCIPASASNHGPVRVKDTHHFAYADGTPYYPIGTTCYAWTYQGEELEAQTLATLAKARFNKLRMCVFPKDYVYNRDEPPRHAFVRDEQGEWDLRRFNPEFFRHFGQRVEELMALGIDADVILFHPYDRWGYARMDSASDDRYLRYVVARLAAYRNVWWSLANQFDFVAGGEEGAMEKSANKQMEDWDRFFQIVQERDPYDHLRSIHNGRVMYDHTKSWVTHASLQSGWHVQDFGRVESLGQQYGKPIVFDEVGYEGDIPERWGSICAQEMVHWFWVGTVAGCYVGHGETYLHPQDLLWWSKGGVLRGQSPARIAFLRCLLEEGPPSGLSPVDWAGEGRGAARGEAYALFYFGRQAPGQHRFHTPPGLAYRAQILGTWEMTTAPVEGTFSGDFTLDLPAGRPAAVRLQQVDVSRHAGMTHREAESA